MIARVIKDDNQNRNSLSFFLFVYESCSVARLPVDSTLYNRVRALSSFLDDWKKKEKKNGFDVSPSGRDMMSARAHRRWTVWSLVLQEFTTAVSLLLLLLTR